MNSRTWQPNVLSAPRIALWQPDILYWTMWLFIVFVSVWDGFLTFVYRSQMQVAELNPMGRALIDLNDGGVTYLLVVKTAGTVVVTSALVTIYERLPRQSFAITGGVACFQLALLLFLSLR